MRILLELLAAAVLLGGCGKAGLGESCTQPGHTDECQSSLVCATEPAGPVVCLKLCTDQSQCATNENCNGTPTTLKACEPK